MASESLPTTCKRSIPQSGPSRVVFNRPVGPGWYLLRLEEPAIARAAQPGQFVELHCAERGSLDPLLRRPFSIYDADPEAGTYDILYLVAGRGTRWMSRLEADSGNGARGAAQVDAIGPFGNRFTLPPAGAPVILAGGGVGVAPLYFFARELLAAAEPPPAITLLMGARTASQLQGIDDFRRLPIRSEVSTNDGSAGYRGFVTQLLEHLLEGELRGATPQSLRLYGCGPTGMNEALRRIAVARGLPCEICLEAIMACGFGICFACVAPIRKTLGGELYNRRVCLEGPVFDARLLGEGLGEGH